MMTQCLVLYTSNTSDVHGIYFSRIFEGQMFDELWSCTDSWSKIWAASADVWWSYQPNFSVSACFILYFLFLPMFWYILVIYIYIYPWKCLVLFLFDWLFSGCLRSLCSMWSALVATKILMLLDKFESILA